MTVLPQYLPLSQELPPLLIGQVVAARLHGDDSHRLDEAAPVHLTEVALNVTAMRRDHLSEDTDVQRKAAGTMEIHTPQCCKKPTSTLGLKVGGCMLTGRWLLNKKKLMLERLH